MHLGEDLLVLGLILLIAYALGRAGKRIGLPAIPIYIVVGLLASPSTGWFPLSFEPAPIELIAVFGLILLLFNLGLEFDLDEFVGNAGKLLVSGGSYVLVNMGVGLAFGLLVGWGTREALVIAGMTATSSSAIVTKLLIELNRLANRETPMILGVTVVEDIFIAIYLAVVSAVLSDQTGLWPVLGQLGLAFLFLIVMFSIARWGGRVVSRLVRTKDDELFTILFFGLALTFAGIGEIIGVTDAIGAFVIGLVLGASRYRNRVEQLSLPMRDVFGAFFFLNFGLALNITTFDSVLLPVGLAVLMTIVLNIVAGQFVSWLNGFDAQAGINTSVILQNRGEFALILATLAISAGLDDRIVPFAGLYVLTMAVIGPILAVNSERIGTLILRTGGSRTVASERDLTSTESIALLEQATAEGGPTSGDLLDRGRSIDGPEPVRLDRLVPRDAAPDAARPGAVVTDADDEFDDVRNADDVGGERTSYEEQAAEQSDAHPARPPRVRDPEY